MQELYRRLPLYRFFLDVTVARWTDTTVVENDELAKAAWCKLWKKYPEFRDVLLEQLSAGERRIKDVSEYLVGAYYDGSDV